MLARALSAARVACPTAWVGVSAMQVGTGVVVGEGRVLKGLVFTFMHC